ncbi:MAG: DUF2721 domain-containing protein [Opitutaceae bacterium]|nr:DUF2721 domain-containing protein [Cytophagales bacterium]
MNELSLTTPALLFPSISLLLLAYTNRYVALSTRIRALHTLYKTEQSVNIIDQIKILKVRILLIRNMQLLGIASVFFAAFSMFLIYYELSDFAHIFFGLSLVMMLSSLAICGTEIYLSNKALFIQLKDIEHLVK